MTGLAVSDRHPYMFSAGLDKMVKCWDLEYNKVRTRPLLSLSTLLLCMTTAQMALGRQPPHRDWLLIYQVVFLIPPPLYLIFYLFFPSFFPKQPAYKT